MTYDEFKDYIITHLWKQGDALVIASLDRIIKTAEDELNRNFKMEDRVTVAPLSTETDTVALPADYREMRHLFSPSVGSYKYIIPEDWADKVARNSREPNEFTVANKTIYLVKGGVVGHPLSLNCWYYRNVPNFASLSVGEVSWMAEEYFDVYLYTVLKHTAPFLREDERLQVWAGLEGAATQSAIDENLDRKFAGSPLKMKMPAGIR